MEAVPEKTVDSWTRLRDVIEDFAGAGWAFRGQADAKWRLESSLTRYLRQFGAPPEEWLARESKILRTFKRKAHLLIPRTPEDRETLEWFALMQHHGAPTRLLDFTWSPYVAAFFALERATEDSAIWAVLPGPKGVPNHRGFSISEILNKLGFDQPQEGVREHTQRFVPPKPVPESDAIPRVVIGEPTLMNQRMTTQAGTFVIPIEDIEVPVESIVPRSSVFKLRLVTQSLRRETMNRLYNMNINNATLFPGIDGLARSLAFELEFNWAIDDQPARRLAPR